MDIMHLSDGKSIISITSDTKYDVTELETDGSPSITYTLLSKEDKTKQYAKYIASYNYAYAIHVITYPLLYGYLSSLYPRHLL